MYQLFTFSYRSPFSSPFGKREEAQAKKMQFAVRNSDHLSSLRAYQAWLEMRRKGEQAAYNFARENFISHKTCEQISDMKHQGRGDAMDHLINGLIWAYLAEILSVLSQGLKEN